LFLRLRGRDSNLAGRDWGEQGRRGELHGGLGEE